MTAGNTSVFAGYNANVQVRRSFGNGGSLRDPAAKETSATKDS